MDRKVRDTIKTESGRVVGVMDWHRCTRSVHIVYHDAGPCRSPMVFEDRDDFVTDDVTRWLEDWGVLRVGKL
jgi:hypothetical protein